MSIIVANGLTHRFGRELALEGVDLVLDTTEHIAVLGDNGAGKTTLLRILATALHPTSGDLQIAGLNAFRERRRLRSRAQSRRRWPRRSVPVHVANAFGLLLEVFVRPYLGTQDSSSVLQESVSGGLI